MSTQNVNVKPSTKESTTLRTDCFVRNIHSRNPFDVIRADVVLARMEKQASRGCGLYYEIYESRLLGMVMNYLAKQGTGFPVGDITVPIVCGAVLFDLSIGSSHAHPDIQMGYLAASKASDTFPVGCYGAGTGASVGKLRGFEHAMKSGAGYAEFGLPGGLYVGAYMAVNACGEIYDKDTVLAGALADADKTEIQKLQTTSGNAKVGIDVSKWNKEIDWDKVENAGVQFAIIRAGYRGSVTGSLVEDPMFVTNMKGAQAAGIPVGVYFFTQAVDEKEAVEEASAVIELIRDYRLNYPVFIDTEGAGGNGRADSLDAETRTLVCEAFCRTIENAGYTAGVYASRNWYNNNLQTARLENYHIWLAEYRSVPLYQGYYKTWQYTSKGKVDGIEGRVDMNITYE